MNFDALYASLDKLYKANKDNVKISGAVVVVYGRMCTDFLLRNKLFAKGKTFWSQIVICAERKFSS